MAAAPRTHLSRPSGTPWPGLCRHVHTVLRVLGPRRARKKRKQTHADKEGTLNQVTLNWWFQLVVWIGWFWIGLDWFGLVAGFEALVPVNNRKPPPNLQATNPTHQFEGVLKDLSPGCLVLGLLDVWRN